MLYVKGRVGKCETNLSASRKPSERKDGKTSTSFLLVYDED
jgi:hypothetical protein